MLNGHPKAKYNGGKNLTIGTPQGATYMHEWNIKVIKDSASEKSNKVVKGELGEKSCADFIANYISETSLRTLNGVFALFAMKLILVAPNFFTDYIYFQICLLK